jgi:DNA uptake protein ComE-like DNA-binding protein
MRDIFIKINRFFAFTRKDRCGIYVLLFLIGATIALRTAYPFWKAGSQEFSDEDTAAGKAAVAGEAGSYGGGMRYTGAGNSNIGGHYARGSNSNYGGNYGAANSGSYANGGSDSGYESNYGAADGGDNGKGKGYSGGNRLYANGSPPAPDKPYNSNYTAPAYMQKKQFVAALNSADTTDLKELKGIGSGFARRIAAYREKLGGFVRKEQLKEVWGIDSALYALIAPQVTIDASQIRKININTATIDVMKKHPYLDYYLAKEIVKYREKYGTFATPNDLQKVALIDEGTYRRIKPYLTME